MNYIFDKLKRLPLIDVQCVGQSVREMLFIFFAVHFFLKISQTLTKFHLWQVYHTVFTILLSNFYPLTNLSMNYRVMCKVYTGVSGI